jgi:hypothetical protein
MKAHKQALIESADDCTKAIHAVAAAINAAGATAEIESDDDDIDDTHVTSGRELVIAGVSVADWERCATWCVYWETAGDDERIVARYATQEAAEAKCEQSDRGLSARCPGGNLLCGYSVRRLVDGEWVAHAD